MLSPPCKSAGIFFIRYVQKRHLLYFRFHDYHVFDIRVLPSFYGFGSANTLRYQTTNHDRHAAGVCLLSWLPFVYWSPKRQKRKKMKQFNTFLAIIGTGLLISACDNAAKTKDTPRRGQKVFYADESFQPLMETSSYTFMGIYPDSELDFVYTGETAAMNAMAQGKTRTIFVSRDFTEKEKKSLHNSNIQVETGVFAHDAVTFIVNLGNNDTLLTQAQLKAILSGKSTVWPASNKPVEVVFDRVQSANFNYMLKWLGGTSYGKGVHATKSTAELIQYVQNHPLTLGVIGYNFISDLDDPAVKNRLKQFKVVAIQGKEGSYWRPNKATITEEKYPFHREIWYINSGAPDGLNTGFIHFLTGRQGQLLLEKCELGPGKGTPREINFITE